MSIRASNFYKWAYGLISEAIKGAAHVGMVILSGTGIAQMIDSASTLAVPTAALQPLTFKYFLISAAIGAGLKAMAYLDQQPLPPLAVETNPPFIA